MEQPRIKASMSVAGVLARWPQTIAVFTHHRMACVGCPIAAFESIAEVTAIYNLDLHCFLCELEQVIREAEIERCNK